LDDALQTDEELALAAAREGSDGLAFRELMGRYRERVWRTCYRLMSDAHDAQDAAQDVFVRLFVARKQFEGRSKYSTWVFGVALRTCLTHRRSRGRRQRRVRLVEQEAIEAVPAKATGADNYQGVDLDHLLAKLSEEDRALLIMKYAEGYSYDELAEVFLMSVSACKMRISRARQRLKQQHSEAVA